MENGNEPFEEIRIVDNPPILIYNFHMQAKLHMNFEVSPGKSGVI